MINILVMKKDENTNIDIIRTKFNGTIEQAKNYYIDCTIAETNQNTILKIFELLLFNGYDIKKINTKYYSRYSINGIELELNQLHDLGELLKIYTKDDNKRCCFTINYGINTLKKLIDNNFFKKLEIDRNFYELLFNINCTEEIIDNTKIGFNNSYNTTKRTHKSGIYTIYKY